MERKQEINPLNYFDQYVPIGINVAYDVKESDIIHKGEYIYCKMFYYDSLAKNVKLYYSTYIKRYWFDYNDNKTKYYVSNNKTYTGTVGKLYQSGFFLECNWYITVRFKNYLTLLKR